MKECGLVAGSNQGAVRPATVKQPAAEEIRCIFDDI